MNEKSITSQKRLSIHFGVGCLHFVPKSGGGTFFVFDKFMLEVRAALESISAISSVNVESHLHFDENKKLDVSESHQLLSEGDEIFPRGEAGMHLTIDFEIYIPYRVQQEISRTPHVENRTKSEKFLVRIRYGYQVASGNCCHLWSTRIRERVRCGTCSPQIS